MIAPIQFTRFVPACAVLSLLLGAIWLAATPVQADEAKSFYRGINLNGPPVTIDGHVWEGGTTADLNCDDQAFENQAVTLRPATDPDRARMIRSSRWKSDGRNRVRLRRVPAGKYLVYLYVWEDNDPQTFTVFVQGKQAQANISSGAGGSWQKLGPWPVQVSSTIEVASMGGHANFSGLEIWKLGKVTPPRPLPPPELVQYFDEHIAPIFARHCLQCHDAATHKGKLDLSQAEAALSAGRRGKVIVPGKPEESLLWERVAADEMPPKETLSAAEKDRLHEWLRKGAPWGSSPINPFRFSSERRAGYDWWSLQPVRRPAVPAVQHKNWPKNTIDHFLLHRLEAKGLTPAPEAERGVLIRRLYFDLLGLPPTPEEVQAFVKDRSPGAYEKLVDQLLESPHYGERWARHWLDIVRFGETQGFERNKIYEGAWRYRDWVIEAFNADLPYDEFIRLQIAGDVLHPNDPLAVIATGYFACGPYDLVGHTEGTEAMRAVCRQDELEDLVGNVGQTFLGLTLNCARCHDHKFDPVFQKEYYQMAAALGGVQRGKRDSLSKQGKTEAQRRSAALERDIQELQRAEKQTSAALEKQRLRVQISRREAVRRLLAGGPSHALTPRQPPPTHVLARGDFRQPLDRVAAAGVAALTDTPADFDLPPDAPEGQRRRQLAEWLVHPQNPLTARVIVNRLWHYHFGRGLVATPSDLGFNGGLPSHPELLDWLASELKDKHWSLKQLHRLMVLSAAYRQSSAYNERAVKVDADNRLLWRKTPLRLEAEAIRDAILASAGELNPALGGPGYKDFDTKSGLNEVYTPKDVSGPEFFRRTIYRTWIRAAGQPFLDVLDCPDPSVSTPARTVTTTPLQALALLNNPFMLRLADKLAQRVTKEAGQDVPQQIQRTYWLTLSRAPNEAELHEAQDFIARHGLPQFCLLLFNVNEFVYID